MISFNKVASDIKDDGKYDAILDKVKNTLKTQEPSFQELYELIQEDKFYVKEYKDLNRWGELSSVHVQKLELKESDSKESRKNKENINSKVDYLINGEEYEIPSKKIIYLSWTGFVAIPSVYVIDNIVRVSSDLYTTNENSVYLSFILVIIASIWGYFKVTSNHSKQHLKYIKTQEEVRSLVKDGLANAYYSYVEVYKS